VTTPDHPPIPAIMAANFGKGTTTAALTTGTDTLAELAGSPDPNAQLNRASAERGDGETVNEPEDVRFIISFCHIADDADPTHLTFISVYDTFCL
jgi:hypothetical protein